MSHLSAVTGMPITFAAETVDRMLGGGLTREALHEIFAAAPADITSATGLTLALAARAAAGRSVLLARQDILDAETGALNAAGLNEMGFDPERFILVLARNVEGALRAGEQAVRCADLGAVMIQTWGESSLLNLTTSRRLSLASAKSGVPVFILRGAASPSPSAAATRWKIQALPSRALEANAPGFPAFELNLLRHRGGVAGHVWRVEWDRDRKCFQERQRSGAAPVSRPMVSVSDDGSTATAARQYECRKTG
jgi:protein ImuA